MPRSAPAFRSLLTAILAAGPVLAQPPLPRIFSAQQVQSGQAIYSQNCSSCHGAGFEGSGDAPALTGGTFLLKWRSKMVSELFGLILQTMPPTNPGALGEAASSEESGRRVH